MLMALSNGMPVVNKTFLFIGITLDKLLTTSEVVMITKNIVFC